MVCWRNKPSQIRGGKRGSIEAMGERGCHHVRRAQAGRQEESKDGDATFHGDFLGVDQPALC
jgi:hypothetical protein